MGEYDPRTKATAGPNEDDRFGSGQVGRDITTRILEVHVAAGRTMVTLARGRAHGIHRGMEGHVKGVLADLTIEDVRQTTCTASVEITPDQLRGHLDVVVNPTSKPHAPTISPLARIIHVAAEGAAARITIARGSAHGIGAGTRGVLVSPTGSEGDTVTIEGTTAMQATALVASGVDHAHQHPNVKFAMPATAPVQRRAAGSPSTADASATAAAGVAGASAPLPFLDVIQRSFGKHDVSSVRSRVGGEAATASEALGARAYATGDHVAFASAPDLHTAAHEAAHTIQQRHGAVGFQGLGAADDEHEHHADAVADAVVAGRSAESLLDRVAGGSGPSTAVQRKADAAPRREPTSTSEGQFVAPPKIELVADGVGRLAKVRAQIAVRAAKGSGPSIVTTASPELFRVIAAPNIMPTTEEQATHNELVIGFGAQQPGTYRGALAIRAQTPGFQDLHIPLVGHTDRSLVPARVPSQRRLEMPASVDLGEHVVGSERLYDIAQLGLAEATSAVVHPLVVIDPESTQSRKGDDAPLVLKKQTAFRRAAAEDLRISSDVTQTLHIFFAPNRIGDHSALLEVPITWEDGVTTKQYVRITGRARSVDQAPESSKLGQVPPSTDSPKHEHLEFNGDAKHDFGLVSELATNAAASIAERQEQGLEQARDASKGYQAKPPEASIIVSLIEAALTMANAGLARFFATKIAQGIVGDVAKGLSDAAAAQAIRDQAKTQLATISEPIREGLKNTGKAQIEKLRKGLVQNDSNHGLDGFWGLQIEALQQRRETNRTLLTNAKYRLEPLLGKHPDVALLAQQTMLRALEATVAQARDAQRMATLSQYLVAVASSAAAGKGDPLQDRLKAAREQGVDYPFSYKNGFLQLTTELQGSVLALRSARITGVSRVVVANFQSATFATLPIPIMVAVKTKAGTNVITRDHHGAIRASGDFNVRTSPMNPEANKIERARELLEPLLAAPLDVPIEHDDVGDHREQAG